MKRSLLLFALVVSLVVLLAADICVANDKLTLSALWDALFNRDGTNSAHIIIWQLRLPRAVLALLAGGALSFSGYLLQSLVSNPLADPYLLGTASGASLGANLVILGWIPFTVAGIYMPPILAFLGGLSVTLLVVGLASFRKGMNPFILVLGGVAIVALVAAILSLMTFMADAPEKIRAAMFWAMGSLEKASWSDIPLLATIYMLILFSGLVLNKPLAMLTLGSQKAHYLGLNVKGIRWGIILLVSLATGTVVAITGPIGFVGLIVPHFTRGLFGVAGKQNVPVAMLIGSAFLLFCDLVGRLIFPPSGLPIGVITAILGVPFFIYLLFKSSYRFQ